LSAGNRDCADWDFAFGFSAPGLGQRGAHKLLVLIRDHI
jgi:hypothetical protein